MIRSVRGVGSLLIRYLIGPAGALLIASATGAHGTENPLTPPPGAQPAEAATGTCPSLVTYYLDDYDLGGDRRMRLMGPLSVDGQRRPARVALWMERGRTGEVTVVMPSGEVREMTPLEFHGRWRSPCDLLGGRQP